MALMREAAVAAGDVPEPAVPSFLMHSRNAEKRSHLKQDNTAIAAFQPS